MKRSFLLLVCSVLSFIAIAQNADSASKSERPKKEIYEITSLTKLADSAKYGLTPQYPVKVGTGPRSGPANQRDYLNLLRDAQGNKVEYTRTGSCCAYESKNGFMGYAMVDKYEVTHKDKDGNTKKTIIYISFYDYEEPLIPVGFQAAPQN